MNNNELVFKLYKKAYDSKVSELTDTFAEEDKNAAASSDSLSTRTLVSGGAGLLGGLLLTKLLDADNSAGIGRYALMGALGAGLGAGAGYYFNKPAVTPDAVRDELLDNARKEDEVADKAESKNNFKLRNHYIGQGAASVWTLNDLRRSIRRHRQALSDVLDVDQAIKSHPTGGKYYELSTEELTRAQPQLPVGPHPKEVLKKHRKATKAWQEIQNKKQFNAELEQLLDRQKKHKLRGYVIGEDGMPKLTGKGQLKGLGKSLGRGILRHGAFGLAAALLNKAL